jgi:hypothetical protein
VRDFRARVRHLAQLRVGHLCHVRNICPDIRTYGFIYRRGAGLSCLFFVCPVRAVSMAWCSMRVLGQVRHRWEQSMISLAEAMRMPSGREKTVPAEALNYARRKLDWLR